MINQRELIEIKGGVSRVVIAGVAGTIITFLIGVFDGYMRPLSCNK